MDNGWRTTQARRVLLQQVAPTYHRASGSQKHRILEDCVTSTGYARKYALWLLNHVEEVFAPPATVLRRRSGPEVEVVLVQAWEILNRLCAKRLIPFLPDLLENLEAKGHVHLSQEDRRLLLSMSAATADRLLQTHRSTHASSLSTTKAGLLLTQQIPIRTFAKSGRGQAGLDFRWTWWPIVGGDDRVASSLPSRSPISPPGGQNVCRCSTVDERRSWRPSSALARASRFPSWASIPITEAHSSTKRWRSIVCANRSPISRGRPYEKRDQCFVEQKNGMVVRQVVGHGRLVGEHAYRQLDELYRALHWYVNCFQPRVLLVSKQIEGRKIHRRYDAAKTPREPRAARRGLVSLSAVGAARPRQSVRSASSLPAGGTHTAGDLAL